MIVPNDEDEEGIDGDGNDEVVCVETYSNDKRKECPREEWL